MEVITMRITVRTQVLALALLALAALAPIAVKAQSRLDVPFNFVVAGKVLPAGTYSMTENRAIGLVSLTGEGREISWMANGIGPASATASLTFDHEGDTYFLRTMRFGRLITPRLDSKVRVRETIAGPTVAVEGQ
jgi:hypothetical protein